MSNTVTLERHGAVALLTLNRPDAANTLNREMALDLGEQARRAADDPSVRCVVLTGAGKLFCGGGDVSAMAAAADPSAELAELAPAFHESTLILATMAKPLVVLVNGAAAGAGMSLAISGDIVLAARGATFLAAYGSVGLTPDGGMSWLLPRLVGLRRAQELIIGGRRLTAEEAAEMGLVTRTVADEALLAEGLAEAQRLADGPIAAMGAARALLTASFANDLAAHLKLEEVAIAKAGGTDEAREGIAAFLARRKPTFAQPNSSGTD
jgi:2-(1,2-epoxy-1,2-dihydrophenyl)acetyl-CoA isomerase